MKKLKKDIVNRATAVSLLALTLLISASCEKVIEPENLPEQDPRLVLNCILDNDSVFTARLSSSKSIVSGKDYKQIEGAYCAVYENGTFVEQLLSKGKGLYKGTKRGKAGNKYTVVARYAGFKDVEGSSIMPGATALKSVTRYDTANNKIFDTKFGSPLMRVIGGNLKYKITIQDNPDRAEHYGLNMKLKLFDAAGNILDTTYSGLFVSFTTEAPASSLYSDGMLFLGDDFVNAAGEVAFDMNVGVGVPPGFAEDTDSLVIECSAVLISEDYFKYFQTAYKQMGQGPSFFMEPVLVYNNIVNGMGIVAARSSNTPQVIYTQKFK